MRNKKYIIGGLIGLCVLMTIAYGAFLTNLNINGTTSITSNWNVLITNIESKTIVGNASNEKEPTHDKLSATFSTKLESPGDSIEYEITVENQGNLQQKDY